MTVADPKAIETAVLAVLTGTPAAEVAAQAGIPADTLVSAAEVYQSAGRAALLDHQNREGWHQARIDFSDWATAERIGAVRLGPVLAEAETGQTLSRWFFTRKAASWRLRWQPVGGGTADRPAAGREGEPIAGVLDAMAERGEIKGWSPSIYEMESCAFGGRDGMELAHRLFHADSAAILRHLASADEQSIIHHRRAELSLLLCGLLLRGAGLDWYEQGDVWARVATHRPPAPGHDPGGAQMAMRRLMTADTGPAGSLITTGALAPFNEWAVAFDNTGRALRHLSDHAKLGRGLRAVLTHHILFHWNRMGLPASRQGTLAALAREAVMNTDNAAASCPGPRAATNRLRNRTTDTEDGTMPADEAQRAGELRETLAGRLRDRGAVRSAPVEAAIRAVPRHLFLPEVSVADAYADTQIVTKTDAAGNALSSVSHPGVVAGMLEQLDVRPGHRVLEIGSGGYNAALLAELVGPGGHVTTLDIDPEVTARARTCLAAAGYGQVNVITGDGEYGYQEQAPYDRIIVTAGAWDLPPAWFRQLDQTGGRLVVPLRLRALSRIVAFAPENGTWRSRSIEFAGFVPMQGAGSHTAHTVPLTPEKDVTLHTDDQPDVEALARVLAQPATEVWTGVTIPHGTSYEHLDLWLAGMPGFSRLTATPDAIASGVVSPTFAWGGSAIHDSGTLAYLTGRETAPQTDGPGTGRGASEVGARAHGPAAAQLADTIAERIQVFDREHRTEPRPIIEVQRHDDPTPPRADAVITKHHVRLIMSWSGQPSR